MLEKNKQYEAVVTDYTAEGQGVAHVEGCVVFLPNAIAGEKYLVRIEKAAKTWAAGKIVEILEKSPHRLQRECPISSSCGGCDFWHMDYAEESRLKAKRVLDALNRIGGENLQDMPILSAPTCYGYRNKAQYPIGTDKDGQPIAGFYAGRTHSIIANTDCYLGVEENKEILEIVMDYMKENHVTAYDESTQKGLIRHVLIRKGFTSGEIMVCLVINKKGRNGVKEGFLPAQDELVKALQAVKGMTSISVSINTENTNVIMGKEVHTIWGKDTISDTIHVRDTENDFALTGDGITFAISPLSFYQVNPGQTEKLYSLALDYADLTGNETVWDLYCGIGTISLFLAGKAKQVYGVEIIPQAIDDARENAKRNHIENATFFVGKAEEVLQEFYEKQLQECTELSSPDEDGAVSGECAGADMLHPDVIVVDPPRKGCDEKCLDTMLKMQPKRIVYVSCDSATLARDLRILCDGGYALKRVRPVDQFAQGVHVETCVLLCRA